MLLPFDDVSYLLMNKNINISSLGRESTPKRYVPQIFMQNLRAKLYTPCTATTRNVLFLTNNCSRKGYGTMFVFSLKANKLRKIVFIALIIIFVVAAAFYLFVQGNENNEEVSKNGINYSVTDAASKIAFISQFGWQVNEDPIEVTEVIIPEEFNETYENYNEIQKEQGLDLSEYKGQRVKRWTYEITNYPDSDADEGVIRINLLVYKDKVIGGDVCSTELDGFMHGFKLAENAMASPDEENTSDENNTSEENQSQDDTTESESD